MANSAGRADMAGAAEGTDATGATGQVRPLGVGERKGKGGAAYGPLLSTAVDIVLPLLVYYAARALGIGQGPALLLGGAPPALRLMTGAVRRRRIDGVDLFFTVLLAAAALATLIGGSTRILLFKDAALSLVVGAWVLGTGFTDRPLAFQLSQRLHRGPAALARARTWRGSADLRRGLRVLTVVWGAEQLLDGAFGTLAAATLPTGIVPLLTRVLSLLLLTLTAAATAAYARRFRSRYGVRLFGAIGTGGGAIAPDTGGSAEALGTESGAGGGTGVPAEGWQATADGGIREGIRTTPVPPRPEPAPASEPSDRP
ncbi:VC0807 family protein [Streptomyces sp. IMTB 2501]|uniref:VC0807 family protein n=1 Tax=Streptomyces sp. IMTB 2501 TaxID=1776340 RepID=UPI0021168620|nr:VC0807 family protein [Streptomyces sp. IMTB 2501]